MQAIETNRRDRSIRILVAFLLCILFISSVALSASAESVGLTAGSYSVDAKLSCYVNAMGGIEFGAPLLKKTQITVDDAGNATLKLTLGKSKVTIYGVTCDTFIDTNPGDGAQDRGVKSGSIGIYDKAGKLQTGSVEYTHSRDTALNTRGEAVHYVDSITMPLPHKADEYSLTVFVNSNVMGVQFCNPTGAAGTTSYPAKLTINWASAKSEGAAAPAASSSPAASEKPAASPSSGKATPAASPSASIEPSVSLSESPEPSPEVTPSPSPSASQGRVVEEEGLSVHYADGKGPNDGNGNGGTTTAFINYEMLLIIGIAALVLIGAGVVFLITSMKTKKDQQKA